MGERHDGTASIRESHKRPVIDLDVMREVDDDAATGTACLSPPDGAGQRDTFGSVHTDTVCDCRPPRAGLDPMSEDVFDEIRAIPPTQAMRNPVNGSDGEHARGSLRHHDPPDHSLALTSGIPPAPAVHGVEYPTSAGRRHRAGPIRGVEARRIHSRPTGDLPKGERAGPAGVTRWGYPERFLAERFLVIPLNDGQPFEQMFEWL